MTLADQMLLEEFQRDRKLFNEEQKLREQWESLMPPKAPGIVPEFGEAKLRHKADHADNIQHAN